MNKLITEDSHKLTISEIEKILNTATIFDKIEFSDVTKKSIKEKINDLRTRQVPKRTVLLKIKSEEVIEYWFKNWLHPSLKPWVHASPKDKRGCSREVLIEDAKRDSLRFYENGQQNYIYSLKEIEEWLEN